MSGTTGVTWTCSIGRAKFQLPVPGWLFWETRSLPGHEDPATPGPLQTKSCMRGFEQCATLVRRGQIKAVCSTVTLPHLQKPKARRKQVFALLQTQGSVIF